MKNITPASSQDAEKILELQKLAYQSEKQFYYDFSIAPLTQTLQELRSEFVEKVFLKAQVADKIVGSVKGSQEGSTCFIERLIVHPDYQGQGIGTALMEQIESCFERAQRFELFTGHNCERKFIFTSGTDTRVSSVRKQTKTCLSCSWRNTNRVANKKAQRGSFHAALLVLV